MSKIGDIQMAWNGMSERLNGITEEFEISALQPLGFNNTEHSLQLQQPTTTVWNLLSKSLCITDSSALFWWERTGQPLAIMLEKAGYDSHGQYAALIFHYQHIIHHLGAPPTPQGSPHSWQSFATDDYSPIEYSWTWTPSPHIRYGVEAIGAYAGSISDPYNQTETDALVNGLKSSIPDLDWRLYDFFRREYAVLAYGGRLSSTSTVFPEKSQSSIGLAFEPWKGRIGAKAYFIPVQAHQKNCAGLDIATESFRKLQKTGLHLPAYDNFLQFMQGKPNLSFLGVAIDCVDVGASRFKLYIRSTRTSFDDVCFTVTTGVSEHPIWTTELISQLRELWYLVLNLEDFFPTTADLPSKDHSTAGVLYNVDIQGEDQSLATTVYIPVRHYARNDLDIAKGLASFLEKRGSACDWSSNVKRYTEMLKGICSYRDLGSGCGVQTYISCKAKKGGLFLTSYLSSEIYSRGVW